MKRALQVLGLVLAFYILAHWFVSGQDNIIEGPPVDSGSVSVTK